MSRVMVVGGMAFMVLVAVTLATQETAAQVGGPPGGGGAPSAEWVKGYPCDYAVIDPTKAAVGTVIGQLKTYGGGVTAAGVEYPIYTVDQVTFIAEPSDPPPVGETWSFQPAIAAGVQGADGVWQCAFDRLVSEANYTIWYYCHLVRCTHANVDLTGYPQTVALSGWGTVQVSQYNLLPNDPWMMLRGTTEWNPAGAASYANGELTLSWSTWNNPTPQIASGWYDDDGAGSREFMVELMLLDGTLRAAKRFTCTPNAAGLVTKTVSLPIDLCPPAQPGLKIVVHQMFRDWVPWNLVPRHLPGPRMLVSSPIGTLMY